MRRNFIITFLLLVTPLVFLFFVMEFINGQVEEEGFRVLRHTTLQLRRDVYDRIMNDQDHLTSIASLIGHEPNQSTQRLVSLLKKYESRRPVSSLAILLPGDELLLRDGSRKKLTGILSFKEEIRKAPYISNKETALDGSGKKVLRIGTPILHNGKATGLLMGFIELDRLPEIIQVQTFGRLNPIYIVEGGSGEFILDTWHKTLGNLKALGERETRSDYDWARMLEDMAEGHPGSIVFLSATAEEYFYMYYVPMGINDWNIMITVPESVLFKTTEKIKKALFLQFAFVLVCYGTFFGRTMFNARRQTREATDQFRLIQQVLHMERLLATAHTNPEHIREALSTVAETLTAESASFLILGNDRIEYSWSVQRDAPVGQKPAALDEVMELPALRTLLMERKSLLLYAAEAWRRLPPHEASELRRMGLRNLMLALVEEPEHSLVGVLAALNMRSGRHNTEQLQIAVLSFSTALNNIKTHLTIKKMGEFDTLTGLKNRNSFENALMDYQTRVHRSLGCVYIDANGLHELNNTHGHEAGDRMLQYIASALRNEFDPDNVYRIGGDEFIAFVLDEEQDSLLWKIRAVTKAAETENYHVATGAAWQHAPLSVHTLLKQAESHMYDAKRAFYSNGNDRRRARRQS